MRRISVWMAVILVVFIGLAEMMEIEFDGKKSEAAVRMEALGQVQTEGRIAEVEYVSEEHFRILLDSDEKGEILYNVFGKSEINIYELPGKRAEVNGELKLPDTSDNPGMFDYRQYLRTEGIYLTGECSFENISVIGMDPDPLKGVLINRVSIFKSDFCRRMDEVREGSAGLFSGMLFGDSSRMSEEIYDSFRENGTAHILSVSGLHVGIIYGAANGIMGKRRKSLAAVCISAAMLAACALLASFSISVMRAVTMIAFHMLAERTHRRYDLISAACITAVIFMIFNPYMLFNSGFILSFSAVISLAVAGGGLNRIIKRKNTFIRIMIPIISIQAGMLPVNIYLFNYFSFAAFISNIPVIFLSSVMIPLGLAGFLISLLGETFDVLFEGIAVICAFLGEMMVFFNDVTGAQGRMGFHMPCPPESLIIIYYILLFMLFSEYSVLHPLNRRSICMLVAAVLFICACSSVKEHYEPEVVFVDVGQGDCIHIRTPSGKNYLVDGGGSLYSDYDVGDKVLLPYLLKNGAGKLDGIFISHLDADHYKGASFLNGVMDTGKIYLYEGYKKSEDEAAARLNAEKKDIYYIRKGSIIHLDEGVSIEMVFPDRSVPVNLMEETDLNELSAVLMLNYKGTRILLTGDIGEDEEECIKSRCRCDIVKVPHHGSRYSSSEGFVAGTGASAAVIQVGNNNFGHPDESVIERYRKKGIIVFRNDEDGAVLVDIDPGGFKVSGFKGGKSYEF